MVKAALARSLPCLGLALVLGLGFDAGAAAPSTASSSRQGGETGRYRIRYGAFGELGRLELRTGAPDAGGRVQAVGSGAGSLLGFGAAEKRIETDFDPARAVALRFSSKRIQDGKTIVDEAAQAAPGRVEIVRHKTGVPAETAVLVRPGPVLDPVALLISLRAAAPPGARVFEVLDGRALWRVTVAAPVPVTGERGRALRFEARAEPLRWDGTVDSRRKVRPFTLDLSDDEHRTPLRLAMAVGIGQVSVELESVDRPRPLQGATTWLDRPGRLLGRVGRLFAGEGAPRPPTNRAAEAAPRAVR